MDTLFKSLATVFAVPASIVGAVCLIPLAILFVLIDLPFIVISSIWEG